MTRAIEPIFKVISSTAVISSLEFSSRNAVTWVKFSSPSRVSNSRRFTVDLLKARESNSSITILDGVFLKSSQVAGIPHTFSGIDPRMAKAVAGPQTQVWKSMSYEENIQFTNLADSEADSADTEGDDNVRGFVIGFDEKGKEVFQHVDPLAGARWSPRFCFQVMDSRPWSQIQAFFSLVASGQLSVDDLKLLELEVPSASSSSASPEAGLKPGVNFVECPRAKPTNSTSIVSDREQLQMPGGNGHVAHPDLSLPVNGTSQGTPGSSQDLEKSNLTISNQPVEQSMTSREHSQSVARSGEAAGSQEGFSGPTPKNPKRRLGGKYERSTFKVEVAYDGSRFEGWQSQPGLLTVQGVLEVALSKFSLAINPRKEKAADGKAAEKASMHIHVAGRTDKGVHAAGQTFSFYTWQQDVQLAAIEAAINGAIPGGLRCVSVCEVPREFHACFSATWRRYLYLLPLLDHEGSICTQPVCDTYQIFPNSGPGSNGLHLASEGAERRKKLVGVDVAAVDRLLRHLEGRLLNYSAFARDTPPGRGSGPATMCHLYRARAHIVLLPPVQGGEAPGRRQRAMCVELQADRFLRRMVRILVATAVREAAAGAADDGLEYLLNVGDRRATAPPAPGDGLCLAGVGYQML